MELRKPLVYSAIGAAACCSLLLGRVALTRNLALAFLWWNLFLAIVPLAAALAFQMLRPKLPWVATGFFLVWFFFLPNAPYLVTDIIHLKNRTPVPIWFDALLLGSFAWVGIYIGYLSLAIMHDWIDRRHTFRAGWGFATVILGLSSLAIYAGRILRWNSWDVVVRPMELLSGTWSRLSNPLGHLPLIAFALAAFVFLITGYRWALSHFGARFVIDLEPPSQIRTRPRTERLRGHPLQ